MKFRNGFVSNSSSSSFVVNRDDITSLQYKLIINHERLAGLFDIGWGDPWSIDETTTPGKIILHTWMDNFNMEEFLDFIGVGYTRSNYGE